MVDFQNDHASFAMVGKDVFTLNETLPQEFSDVSRLANRANSTVSEEIPLTSRPRG